MKNILVLCDFSTPSDNALKFGIEIAEKAKCNVFLLNVIELPDLYFSESLPPKLVEIPPRKGLTTVADLEFNKLKPFYQDKGIAVTSSVLFGSVSDCAIEFCRKKNIDLILMGSHGISGFKEPFFGSNVTKIVRRSNIPVMIVKGKITNIINSIVFPNDLTLHQDDLVTKIKSLQNFFEAKIHIVWINTLFNFRSDVVTRKKLEDFASHYQFENFTLNIFNHDNEDQGITLFNESIKGDMIAMGTHGRKGLSHLLYGSVAEEEANHADALLWTYSMTNALIESKLSPIPILN